MVSKEVIECIAEDESQFLVPSSQDPLKKYVVVSHGDCCTVYKLSSLSVGRCEGKSGSAVESFTAY